MPHCFGSASEDDPWSMIQNLVTEFNKNRERNVRPGSIIVYDESMSQWKPRTSKTGGLPHLSYIQRKPRPLGTEFKNAADAESGMMLWLEIQRGKSGMSEHEFVSELGPQAACSARLAKASLHLQGGAGRLCLGDSWFGSVKTAVKHKQLGMEFTGGVKTCHASFPKAEMAARLEDKPSGTHAVATATVSGVDLIATGYKYNRRKVASVCACACASTLTLMSHSHTALAHSTHTRRRCCSSFLPAV